MIRPVETLQVHITPSDFFTGNPAIDVPSNADIGSKLANGECQSSTTGKCDMKTSKL